MFTCKPYEIDSEMPIFPSSEDDHVGFEQFLVEPVCREDWVSGLLDLDALRIEKCFDIEDITSSFDCDQIKLDLDAVQPRLTDEERKNHVFLSETSQGLLSRVHGDNQYGAKHANEASDATHSNQKKSCLENSGVGKQYRSILKVEPAGEKVELSSLNTSVLKKTKGHQYSSIDQVTENAPHKVFENSVGLETLFIDKDWPKKHDISGLNKCSEFDNSLDLIKYKVFTDENDDTTAFSSVEDYTVSASDSPASLPKHPNISQDHQIKRKRNDGCEIVMTSTSDVIKADMSSVDEEDQAGQSASRKRSRKPPRRYIEESIDYEFKPFNKKIGAGKKSKDRLLQERFPKQKSSKEFPVEQAGFEDDSFNVGCIQVPFGLPVEKELPKKIKPSLVWSADDLKESSRPPVPCEKLEIVPVSVESQEDFSEDECATRSSTPKGNNCRRKRHISWTPEEVVKLVDGVAQCGVGRWTEIKRLLFSSSSHRTSVDLKDKWRNLLRASCNQLQIKEKVEQGRKQSSNYVSESILWRVKELAVLYPYPRDNRAKVSCTAPAFPTRSSNALVPLSTVV